MHLLRRAGQLLARPAGPATPAEQPGPPPTPAEPAEPTWRRVARRLRHGAHMGWLAAVPGLRFDDLTTEESVRMAFTMLLRRDPDPVGAADYVDRIHSGALSRHRMVQLVLSSSEFRLHVPFEDLLASMHLSRCQFVRGLPRARRILDLGGTDQIDERGAMVSMGYPYAFDRLVIVDLPPEDRHELYRPGAWKEARTELGPVAYHYHSMVDLSPYPDGSMDLVYSGQSIEHITRAEAGTLLAEVRRVLRPGGTFALDTPNGPVWRRRYPDELINPDHKIEYAHEELRDMLQAAGFEVVEAKGLNYLGTSLAAGGFDEAEAARNIGVFDEIAECLNLAYICRAR